MTSLKVKEVKARINNALDELDRTEDPGVAQFLDKELIELNADIITPINELLCVVGSGWELKRMCPDIRGYRVSFDLYHENRGFGVEMSFKASLPLFVVLPIFATLR